MRGVELTTPDLLIREFVLADWEAVHTYARLPETVRYETWGPNTEGQSWAFVDAAVRAQEAIPRLSFDLAITLRRKGELVGSCSLRICEPAQREAEIGYVVAPRHWRNGYATQTARALIRFGFDRLQLHRIRAFCHVENQASIRVLEKVGMQQEGRLRSRRFRNGAWHDSFLYAVLENDPLP